MTLLAMQRANVAEKEARRVVNEIDFSSSVAPELTFWRAKQNFCSSKNELRLVQRSKLGVRIIPEINVCSTLWP